MDIEATVGFPSWTIEIDHDWAVPTDISFDKRGWMIPASSTKQYTAEDGLLHSFASLAKATDSEIIDAARRWGLLREWAVSGLRPSRSRYRRACDHRRSSFNTGETACDSCRPETADEWREMACLVGALVDILSHRGGPCPLDSVRALPTHHLEVWEKDSFSAHELAALRRYRKETDESAVPMSASLPPNSDSLARWTLSAERYEPRMPMFFGDSWPDSRHVTAFILSPWLAKTTKIWFNGTHCHLRANGLAGELAIQLVSLADGGQRVETCSNCSDIFEPAKRRRRPGDASYCATCRARPDFEAIKRRLSRERRRRADRT